MRCSLVTSLLCLASAAVLQKLGQVSDASHTSLQLQNTVATYGSAVIFQCHFSSSKSNEAFLQHTRSDGSTFMIYPFDKSNGNDRYYANRLSAQCEFTINSVTYEDAGLYQFGNGKSYGAELVVVEEKPSCTTWSIESDQPQDTIVEGQWITIKCSVSMSTSSIHPNASLTLHPHSNAYCTQRTVQRNASHVTLTTNYRFRAYGQVLDSANSVFSMNGQPPVQFRRRQCGKECCRLHQQLLI